MVLILPRLGTSLSRTVAPGKSFWGKRESLIVILATRVRMTGPARAKSPNFINSSRKIRDG